MINQTVQTYLDDIVYLAERGIVFPDDKDRSLTIPMKKIHGLVTEQKYEEIIKEMEKNR